jgi:hypothetical protein
LEVSGSFVRLETARFGPVMFRRMTDCRFCSLLPILGPLVGIGLAIAGFGLTGSDMAGEGFGFSILVGGLIGWISGLRLCQWVSTRALNRVMTETGRPAQTPYRAVLSPKGILLESERQSHFGAWASLSDLLLIETYWAFVCDGMGLFVPRRFFTSPEQEQAFLAEALSRMPERARKRSLDALDVAEGRPLPGLRPRPR